MNLMCKKFSVLNWLVRMTSWGSYNACFCSTMWCKSEEDYLWGAMVHNLDSERPCPRLLSNFSGKESWVTFEVIIHHLLPHSVVDTDAQEVVGFTGGGFEATLSLLLGQFRELSGVTVDETVCAVPMLPTSPTIPSFNLFICIIILIMVPFFSHNLSS